MVGGLGEGEIPGSTHTLYLSSCTVMLAVSLLIVTT